MNALKIIFNAKPICIFMDESSDDYTWSIINTLFTYRSDTKLVSVDFLEQVNNSTIA